VTPSLPLVGEDFAGYRLRAVLGRGGMSVVYEAENTRLGSTIALKVLAPELSAEDVFRTRFLKESRIAASLNHPHVIPIYDTGPCEGLLYIAMRYVSGSDLRTVLKRHERLSASQALLVIGQTGRALDAAHRHGLVHRDVKPANVLIERGADEDPDHVYLADFGITKHALSHSGLTATGQLVGTIDYIAPEQIQDKAVDGRADIYSLGCVLYQCLTGQVPFVKDLDAAVIWAHVEELPTPPSKVRAELPGRLDEVIACVLAKDPDDRYATCREFVAAARAALESVPETSSPQTSDVGLASGPPSVLSARRAEAVAPPGTQRTTTPPEGDGSHERPPSGSEQAATGDQPPRGRRVGRRGAAVRGRLRLAILGIVAALIAGGVIGWALSRGGGSKAAGARQAGEPRAATLAPVPTNHVRGAGTAVLRLNGDRAAVTLSTYGLLNGAPHLMHIHAGGLGTCPPASAARLHNGHLAISTEDGGRYYGPPEASLTTSGDTSVASFLDFARFPRTGDIRYQRTVQLSRSLVEKIRANKAVVVIHGIDYDRRGIYDNVLSHSELLPAVPGEATAPALCGPLAAARPAIATTDGASSHGSGATEVYVARLSLENRVPSWWCEAPAADAGRARDRSTAHAKASGAAA
jgi:serine/threonine protein kinase